MTRKIISLIMLVLAISACSQQDPPAPSAEAAPTSGTPQAAPMPGMPQAAPMVADSATAVTPTATREIPNPDTPVSAYRSIDGNLDLLYLYYAFSDMPIEYELLAVQVSGEYRSTSDGFKKQEIMAVLKPKIDAKIEEMKTGRYFTLKTELALNHYDFNLKSFPVQGMSEGLYITYSDYFGYNSHTQVAAKLTNSGEFSRYREDDMEKAKVIESVVSAGKARGPASLYLFVNDTDSSDRKSVNLQILQIQMQDYNGKPIATLRAGT